VSKLTLVACVLVGVVVPRFAAAADVPVGEDHKVEVHGFVSPGFIVTSGNNYLAHSKRGSFEFSEVGLNFTVPITDKLRTGMQLFARDLGPVGNYSVKADWYYLDYRFDDWFGIRAGRVKIPFGLYNDTADIDTARVPVLLPQSIYSVTSRDYLLAQTGGEMYGRLRLGKSGGAFEYRLYGGTIFIDKATQSTVNIPVTDIDVPFVAGQRLMWETPIDGLRLGGSLQALKLDLSYQIPAGIPGLAAGPASIKAPVKLWVGSVEFARDRFLLAAEYSRWIVLFDTSIPLPTLPSGTAKSISERAYVMGSYRVTDWLSPGMYYSVMYPDVENRSGKDKQMHDVAATLRFDINSWWLVKLEGHYMSGTAGLDPSLNDGKQLTQLQHDWTAFFVKTTAHF
jgi:hypothetical protein